MNQVKDLKSAQTLADFRWPEGVPYPYEGIKLTDIKEKAVFDLVCMAGGYIFLHEIRHAQLYLAGDTSMDETAEERECDSYARTMMLDGIPEYSEKSGDDPAFVAMKRTLGILFAKMIILTMTPFQNWSDSQDHPAVKDRIREVLDGVEERMPEVFWLTCAAMLAAFARYYALITAPIAFKSYRELSLILCDMFDSSRPLHQRSSD